MRPVRSLDVPGAEAARPQRVGFLIFHTPGKLIRHARQLVPRLVHGWQRFADSHGALRLLPLPLGPRTEYGLSSDEFLCCYNERSGGFEP